MDAADLVSRTRRRARLPEPAVRRLIRERACTTQQEIGDALGVSRVAVTRWDAGTRTPRGELREAYIELLDRLAGSLR